MDIDDDHKLVAGNVSWQPSPNHGGNLEGGEPDTIIIHYTAGSSAESSVRTLSDPANQVSAHLVIAQNGDIFQLVPFNTVAWHAGRSSWKGRSGFNKYSVGIEIDNAGILTPNGSGKYLSWFNRVYDADQVIKARHKHANKDQYWHRYSEEQIESVFEICQCLVDRYPIKEILGHDDIAPSRKTDPGPAFPLQRLQAQVFEKDRKLDEPDEGGVLIAKDALAHVTAPLLNIRSGPGTAFEKIDEPLREGQKVEVVERIEGWSKVRYVTEGWVSSKYLS